MLAQHHEAHAIVERIEFLEKSSRRLRVLLVFLLLIAGSAATLAFNYQHRQVVRAERLILVDSQGREHGSITAEQGYMALRVLTPQAAPGSRRDTTEPRTLTAPTTLLITGEGNLVLMQGGRAILRLGHPKQRFVR